MRLVSVYFVNNSRLGDETFNFGGNFFFKITFKNQVINISRKKNNNFIKEFYSKEISLFSSIVGQNGAGKTTLLKSLKDENIECFLVFENDEEKQFLYYNREDSFDKIFKSYNFGLLEITFDKKDNFNKGKIKDHFDDTTYNHLKKYEIQFLFYHPNSIYDANLRNVDDFVVKNHEDNINTIQSETLGRQIRFLSNVDLIKKIKETYNDFPFYETISIIAAGSFMKRHRYHDIRKYALEHSISDYDVEEQIKNGGLETRSIFTKLNELFNSQKINSTRIFISIYYRFLYILINQTNNSLTNIIGDLDNVLEKHLLDIRNKKIGYKLILELFTSFDKGTLFSIKDDKDLDINVELDLFFDLLFKYVNDVSNTVELKNGKFEDLITFIQAYHHLLLFFEKQFLKINNNSYEEVNFLKFETDKNLSSGEISLINFFSSIYSIKQKIEKNAGNENLAIFLLDEPEIGFHPLWKKRFVSSIVKVLPVLIKDVKIQIILSTHDALTLSDFPDCNVMYLNKIYNNKLSVANENIPNKTFGSNINELLSNVFFLNDELIGDFAREKIENIILKLNFQILKKKISKIDSDSNSKEHQDQILKYKKEIKEIKKGSQIDFEKMKINLEKEDILKIIDLIGEPIIKYKLLDMYEEAFGEDKFIKAEKIKMMMKNFGLTEEDIR